MKQLRDETIISSLRPYGVAASTLLCDQIRSYIDLLLRWNKKTSITAVTDPEAILRFHFGESLLAVETVPIRYGRLADVGSGAGFPAVPIRMVSTELSVILIESNSKKATFLAEIARELHITNLEVRRCRMEDTHLESERVNFVTARALGISDDFLQWSRGSLDDHGSVALWLGEGDAGKIARKSGWRWADPIRIPQSDRRVILRGSKIQRASP
jgi:16S rRNA (guanine527-N7)-methyltransferase